MKDLRHIADENSLEYIETTSERNGYPSNIRGAIVGFNTFKEAEELAEQEDLEIFSYHKRDGWQLWTREDIVYTPYQNSAEDYGDNYSELGQMEEDDFIEQEVKWFFEDDSNFESFDMIENFIKEKKELWEEVEKLDDNEIVITYMGAYYETILQTSMGFSHDTHNYIIGLQEKN